MIIEGFVVGVAIFAIGFYLVVLNWKISVLEVKVEHHREFLNVLHDFAVKNCEKEDS